jgi:2-furoyl-CoA dehydrogenase FAD binding subunit
MLSTAREADEMVVAVRYPVCRAGDGFAFREVARRRGDFAVVAVAAAVSRDRIRIGIGGVADKPAVREWEMLDGSALDDALNALAWELGGYDDIHATAQYRRKLVRSLGRSVIEEAKSCRA